MRNQIVLEIFPKTAFTLRIRERSFGEAVNFQIVFSVDVGEGQFLKARNEIFVSQHQWKRSGGERAVEPIA